jgi:hypothetical protein
LVSELCGGEEVSERIGPDESLVAEERSLDNGASVSVLASAFSDDRAVVVDGVSVCELGGSEVSDVSEVVAVDGAVRVSDVAVLLLSRDVTEEALVETVSSALPVNVLGDERASVRALVSSVDRIEVFSLFALFDDARVEVEVEVKVLVASAFSKRRGVHPSTVAHVAGGSTLVYGTV